MAGATVRPLEPGDRDAVRRQHWETFGPELAFDEIVLDRLFLHEQAVNLVAEMDGQVVGYCSAIHGLHDPARLFTIHVAPEARGQGIAADLLVELERRLVARGCGRVELYVHTENEAAIGLYEDHGYEIVGEDPTRYPTLDPASGYTMAKQLAR